MRCFVQQDHIVQQQSTKIIVAVGIESYPNTSLVLLVAIFNFYIYCCINEVWTHTYSMWILWNFLSSLLHLFSFLMLFNFHAMPDITAERDLHLRNVRILFTSNYLVIFLLLVFNVLYNEWIDILFVFQLEWQMGAFKEILPLQILQNMPPCPALW